MPVGPHRQAERGVVSGPRVSSVPGCTVRRRGEVWVGGTVSCHCPCGRRQVGGPRRTEGWRGARCTAGRGAWWGWRVEGVELAGPWRARPRVSDVDLEADSRRQSPGAQRDASEGR